MNIYCEINNPEHKTKNKYTCAEYTTQGTYIDSKSLEISSETQKINTDISSEKTDISSIETFSPVNIYKAKPIKKTSELKEILIICLVSFLIIIIIDLVINLR